MEIKTMNNRATIEKLETMTDQQVIESILRDKLDEITNIYSPLSLRIQAMLTKLYDNTIPRLQNKG